MSWNEVDGYDLWEHQGRKLDVHWLSIGLAHAASDAQVVVGIYDGSGVQIRSVTDVSLEEDDETGARRVVITCADLSS